MAVTEYLRTDITEFVTGDANPDATYDNYKVGTLFYNSSNNRLYICLDNTAATAVWRYMATT